MAPAGHFDGMAWWRRGVRLVRAAAISAVAASVVVVVLVVDQHRPCPRVRSEASSYPVRDCNRELTSWYRPRADRVFVGNDVRNR